MASNESPEKGNDFIKIMDTFPCLFNVGMMKTPSHVGLKLLKRSLEADLEKEDEKFEGQRLKNVNVLSWVYFQLGNLEEARSKNDDALIISQEDLVTLGNRAFLEWYSGSNLSTFLDRIENLKLEDDFPEKRMDAIAFQAKLLFQLGGHYNMSLSMKLYSDLMEKGAENFYWNKYHHCVARVRLMVMARHSDANETDDEKAEEEDQMEQMFRDVAENTTDDYLKSLAMCELALLMATNVGKANKRRPVDELVEKANKSRLVEKLVEKALILSRNSAESLRICGTALTRLGNPSGINLLEKSASLKENTMTQHYLAKCYTNNKLTGNLDQKECDEKAIFYFQKSYDTSWKENIKLLNGLGFLYVCRKRFEESLEIYRGLIQNWSFLEALKNPVILKDIYEKWYNSLQKTGGRRQDPYFDRYVTIALSTSLQVFKHKAPSGDKSLFFELVVDPAARGAQKNSFKYMLYMLDYSTNEQTAQQKLLKLKRQGNLDGQYVVEEANLLLEEGCPGEALLMLDIAELQMHIHPVNLQKQAMAEEAKWQLSNGLVSCKVLFHRLFSMYHSDFQDAKRVDEIDDNDKGAEAGVLILQDGHHWRPFLQDNTELSGSDKAAFDVIHQNHMYEDVLQYLFDLETTCNPWLPFSGGHRPDTGEFSVLLKQFTVQLVLLVVDASTSNEFLQMADFLLSKSLEAKETDMGIIYTEGNTEPKARDQMPNLADSVRCFKADENGFKQRRDAKPVTDLIGKEMIDAYFSGDAENAMKFFKFLAPHD